MDALGAIILVAGLSWLTRRPLAESLLRDIDKKRNLPVEQIAARGRFHLMLGPVPIVSPFDHLIGSNHPVASAWGDRTAITPCFVTPVHRGRKVPWKTSTSASVDTCQAIPTLQACRNASSSSLLAISTTSRESASTTEHPPKCSGHICKREAEPLP